MSTTSLPLKTPPNPPARSGTTIARVTGPVTRGEVNGAFGYTGDYLPNLGADGRFQVRYERVVFGRALKPDEVDLDSGFLILAAAIPEDVPAPTGVFVRSSAMLLHRGGDS